MGNSVTKITSTPERHGERQITSCMEIYVDSEHTVVALLSDQVYQQRLDYVNTVNLTYNLIVFN